MTYISTLRRDDEVLVWERNHGERELKTYQAPFYFYIKSDQGKYTSIYGDKLKCLSFDTASEFQRARAECQSANIEMFESDIPAELKILSQNYYNVEPPNLHVTFYDIEVDYSEEVGFASSHNPYAPINSVALYHQHQNRYVVLVVPPDTESELQQYGFKHAPQWFVEQMGHYSSLPDNTEVILCKDEKQLLMYFLVEIEDSDIILGWNSDIFDMPYVGKRLLKYGRKYFNMLSFPEADSPTWRETEILGNTFELLDLSGRISADYMVLFRKYEMAERQSYKLEAVAEDMLPHMPKMEYEGSLASLYRDNFAQFVRYNIRDTEILHGLENVLGYVDLANQMYHLSTGTWKHVTGTLKLAELATINYCHHELDNLIVNDIHPSEDSTSIQGAFVLDPKAGLHEWIGSVDINSLYPSSIRSLNISPEKLIGQFTNNTAAIDLINQQSEQVLTLEYDDGDFEQYTASEWRDKLAKRQWAISGYGTVFDQSTTGIIPEILAKWYATRKQYQKQAKQADANGDKIKATYFDKLQYVFKIKLNSFYGALTNQYFRFYDLRMGESTTATGRTILQHQCAALNQVLGGDYDAAGDSVIYGDTDSVTGDSLIDTNYGTITVEQLFNTYSNQITITDKQVINTPGVQATTFDRYTETPYYGYVKSIYRHKVSKPCWHIEDYDGNVVKVTNDHSVMVYRNNQVIECTPSQIDPETDKLVSINGYMTKNIQYKDIKCVKQADDFEAEYVYDLVMEDQHNPWFFANNILVHNSTYFKTHTENKDTAIKVADHVADLVSQTFPQYMREMFLCQPSFDDIIKTGREVVSDRGIFVDKKRYILHLIDKEGKQVDEMKVMGLDTKKTTLPREVSQKLNHFVERYLKGEDWDVIAQDIVDYKEHLKQTDDIMSIGLPKGCKKVEYYKRQYDVYGDDAHLPGHIAAAILYNKCLEHFDDKQSMPINSGMKIKVFYLPKRLGKFKSIAIPVDIEQVPQWFYDNFKVDKDAHIERLVDKPLRNIIKAVGKDVPTKQSLVNNDLLVFDD